MQWQNAYQVVDFVVAMLQMVLHVGRGVGAISFKGSTTKRHLR